jgi:hypothetical protein
LDHAIELVIDAILTLCGIVMTFIGIVDGFLANLMTAANISPSTQLIVLMVMAIFLAILALRAFGGLVSLLIIILLVLLLLHRLIPNMQIPIYNVVPGMPPPSGNSQTQI